MMISFMFPQSPFQVTTIIFYTCIWLPLLQIKQALLQLLGLTPPTAECGHAACRGEPNDDDQLHDLPVAAFHEVEGTDAKVGELCSICLAEFQAEEEVSQLPVCGHIFHVRCIRNWVDRDQFTCPLCRCLIFRIHDYCGKCGLLCTN